MRTIMYLSIFFLGFLCSSFVGCTTLNVKTSEIEQLQKDVLTIKRVLGMVIIEIEKTKKQVEKISPY